MLITTAAYLTAVGLVCWIAGTVLGQHEVAMIGGVIVVGVGAMMAGGDLQYEDGYIETELDDGSVEVEHTTASVETPQNLGLGGLTMLLGGVFVLRSLNNLSET